MILGLLLCNNDEDGSDATVIPFHRICEIDLKEVDGGFEGMVRIMLVPPSRWDEDWFYLSGDSAEVVRKFITENRSGWIKVSWGDMEE